jgi:Mrp family chromosome partitioning ATPase
MNEIRKPAVPNPPVRAERRDEPAGPMIVWDGVLGFAKRRRRTIAATTAIVTLLGIAAIVLVPWNYKATAVITLNAYPAIPENPNVHTPIPQTERMQREIQGLQSRALAAQVIEKLSLHQSAEFDPDKTLFGDLFGWIGAWFSAYGRSGGAVDTPTRGELDDLRRAAIVDIFMDKLTITPVLTAEQVQVTFSSRNPRTAYRVANGIVDTYIQSAMGLRGETLQKAADALQDRISSVKDELRDLPVSAGGANTIERQLEAKRTLLQAYIAKLGELLLLKSAIEPRIFVQSRAVYPLQRAGVPLALGVPFLLAGGLLMGMGVGLIQEGRQKAVTGATQLEALLGLRVIGLPDGDSMEANRVLSAEPKRLARGAERVAMELLMMHERGRNTGVAFVSPSQNEAKSAICVEAAGALARAGHRTLVVDATLARSQAQTRLAARAARDGGRAAGESPPAPDFELRRDSSNALDILITGLDRDSAVADYEKAAQAALKLAPGYAFTLIDLPPMGPNPEARFLARHVDLAVLVTRRYHDRREQVRAAVDQLNASGVRVVGAVLTRGTFERGMLSRAADRLGLTP